LWSKSQQKHKPQEEKEEEQEEKEQEYCKVSIKTLLLCDVTENPSSSQKATTIVTSHLTEYFYSAFMCLQCSDTVSWVAGRASGI